jgi:prophage regulatory protein
MEVVNRLVRERERKEITGVPCSTWYGMQAAGLAPRPVKIGASSVGWPLSELAALNAARIAGAKDDEIRALVQRLVSARARAFTHSS